MQIGSRCDRLSSVSTRSSVASTQHAARPYYRKTGEMALLSNCLQHKYARPEWAARGGLPSTQSSLLRPACGPQGRYVANPEATPSLIGIR